MRKLKNSELNRIDIETFKEQEKTPIIVVLDNIRSGNNIGSVFRTSDGLRIEAIYLCGYTATPPNKEIQKTALDADKSMHWEYFDKTEQAIEKLKENGYKIYAAEQVKCSILLPEFKVKSSQPVALVFGNEVKGVQQKVVDLCDGAIEIPQFGTKHSFNISVSAGIILWDLFSKMNYKK